MNKCLSFIFLIQLLILLVSNNCNAQSTQKNSLFVFVAENIDSALVSRILNNKNYFDGSVGVKFKVIKKLYGEYPLDTIKVYIGDGIFRGVSKFKNILLFVRLDSNGRYHEFDSSHGFADLYKTVDGKWATPHFLGHIYKANGHKTIPPKKIKFIDNVEFSITDYEKHDKDAIKELFPSPYFIINNGKAIAVKGRYLDDFYFVKEMPDPKNKLPYMRINDFMSPP